MIPPATALQNAIISRLKGDPRWIWDIYGQPRNPGKRFLKVEVLASTALPAARIQYIDYFVTFDAIYQEPSMKGQLSNDVTREMCFAAERIVTLSNYGDGFSRLSFPPGSPECMYDIGHFNDTPAVTIPDRENVSVTRQIIKFTVSYNPGG